MIWKYFIALNLLVILISYEPADEAHISWIKGTDCYLRSYGYSFEWRNFKTKDGVNLKLHHIWKGNANTTGIPALFVHGVLNNGDVWLLSHPKDSFALLFADEGYDVWLVNLRGSSYSPWHPANNSITIDDHIRNDLPDAIDFILGVREVGRLHLVGFSMGTTVSLGMLSSKPEYNDKVRLAVLLVPATYFTPVVSLRAVLAVLGHLSEIFSERFVQLIDSNVCRTLLHIRGVGHLLQWIGSFIPVALNYVMNVLTTSRISQEKTLFNISNTARFVSRGFPDNIYDHQYKHYGQMACRKRFESFNFSLVPSMYRKNYEVKGYDISKITANVLMLEASNDLFSQPEDYNRLRSNLQNLVGAYLVKAPNFQHGDPVLGSDTTRIFGQFFLSKVMAFDSGETLINRPDPNSTQDGVYLRQMRPGDVAESLGETSLIDAFLTKAMHSFLDYISRDFCRFYGQPP